MGNRETQTRQCSKTERHLFVDPEDGEYKETIINARRKLEVPMDATDSIPSQSIFLGNATPRITVTTPQAKLDELLKSSWRRRAEPSRGCPYQIYTLAFRTRTPRCSSEKLHAKFVARSCDVEGHARFCVERNCEVAKKKGEQVFKVSSLCLDDHQFQTGRIWISWRIITSLLTNCLKNVCTWHELEDQAFCGLSTNLQEQSQNGRRHATDDDFIHSTHY